MNKTAKQIHKEYLKDAVYWLEIAHNPKLEYQNYPVVSRQLERINILIDFWSDMAGRLA